jgi:type I restriction enzyme S subunit
MFTDAPMSASGVKWIGDVPAHWKTKKAKFLFTQSRLPVQKDDEVVTAYRDGQVTLRSNRRKDGYTFAILEQGYQGIRKGQLVLNSMDAFAGAIGVSESDGKCSPEYVICNPISRKEVNPMYYALILREMALAGYIEVICSAVRQRALRIRYNNLAPLLLPVPPIDEQNEIVKRVSDIKDRFDIVIGMFAKGIDAAKEYRTVLISNAVTGKIKV